MIRPILFALAALTLTAVAAIPVVVSFVLVHAFTMRPAAFWAWLVGLLVYTPVAAVALMWALSSSGLIRWAEMHP